MFDDIAFARALHVLALVHWIGGVAFVTLIILPLARSRATAAEALAFFQAAEERFSRQVRISIPVAGAAGFWMTYRMDLWSRFADRHFWWMSAMFGLWLAFMAIVFVVEPLLHERFERMAQNAPFATLRRIAAAHAVLLALAALTILGAVVGAHGVG